MKMSIRIVIGIAIISNILILGFLLNRVDSLQQSVNLLNNAVINLSVRVYELEGSKVVDDN